MPNLPKPLVTVVIPLHNYARFVTDTIRSVQAQTLNNFECFIVNDSSTDNSGEVAREATKNDLRFKVFDVDFGNLSDTRNFGIAQGDAPYLCCVDSDDRLGSPLFLETLVNELSKDRTLGIAFTGIRIIDEKGNLGHKNAWPQGYDFDAQLQRRNQVPSCCVFLREAWKRCGGFRHYFYYVQDAEFWTQVGSLGYGAKFIDTDWFHYRLHNNSQSQAHRTGEIPEPDWTEFYPFAKDNMRPFASDGKPPLGSWPVRFYNEPDVSIIIPVGKGHERAVKDALHSVEGQTHRFWECIVVDDTPNELDLTGFPWVKRTFAYKFRRGAGAARNQGAEIAQAPFLVFLDADDMLKPRFLELCLRSYQRTGKYAYTDWITHEKQTNFQNHATPEYSMEAFRESYSIHPVTTLIPRKWFNEVGGFDETMPAYEDVDLYLKFLTRGFCGVRIPEPLLIYNINSGQRRKSGKAWEPKFRALMKERYGAFMESNTMCSCIEPPKGKQAVPPTPENAAEYRDTYGDMIKVEYIDEYAPLAPVTFKGPATKVNYGRRARGEVFMIWEKDLTESKGVFRKIVDYVPEPIATIIPPPPAGFDEVPIERIAPVMATMQEPDASPVLETVLHENADGGTMVFDVPIKPRGKPGRKAKK